MMSSISITELQKHLSSLIIIDIRSIQSYNNNHIPGAINIPFEKLIIAPKEYLELNLQYCLYCQKGLISSKACQILSRLGYHVVNLHGGYEEWILQN